MYEYIGLFFRVSNTPRSGQLALADSYNPPLAFDVKILKSKYGM